MTAPTLARAAGAAVSDAPPACRVSLRLADPAAMALPTRIGVREAFGPGTALCLGPDEWLLEAPEAAGPTLRAALAAAAGAHSAVDVSDREATLLLEGPAVLDLLATGCPRDLARMPIGHGARTLFDTVQVVLVRDAEDRFRLTVWRSFAPHLRALLDIALRELDAGL